jgi:hypothetical protein
MALVNEKNPLLPCIKLPSKLYSLLDIEHWLSFVSASRASFEEEDSAW